jgi:hypothetical protein
MPSKSSTGSTRRLDRRVRRDQRREEASGFLRFLFTLRPSQIASAQAPALDPWQEVAEGWLNLLG